MNLPMTPLTADELKCLEDLHAMTTQGEWKSWIEGRDHESGSNFISTSGDDIELTGATHADQDFIGMAHSCFPGLIEELRHCRAKRSDQES
ncbi:hypothetical protein V2O64_15900 [Verrucomicrobiaceae bacterium 227]